MTTAKTHESKVKDIIKAHHEGKFYDNHELTDIINTIVISVKTNCNLENEQITTIVIQYLYCGRDGKFFFNSKRKQTKIRESHLKILNSTKKESYDNSNIVINNSIKINTEPTSEELEELEKEIFGKIEGKKSIEFKQIIINDYDSDNYNDNIVTFEDNYTYPKNYPFKYKKPTSCLYEPYGTQWLHDEQIDDVIDDKILENAKKFDIIRAIVSPPQGTMEWHKMRDDKITASDGGTVVDCNKHEPQFGFIKKKTLPTPFLYNEFVHHGKKHEDTATMIYEYRMNVSTDEFGLIGHPKYSFLGASPDRICNKYKLDGIHKSKFIGRMLEIKCPYVRKIKMDGPIVDHICPIYYWVQVQLQLECCDLDECDFWQCEIKEYASRNEFNEDTNVNEPFKSKTTGFEKGCIIQLLPKKRMNDIIAGNYKAVVEESSKYIYAPKIEMSPYDCDVWVAEKLTNKFEGDIENPDDYFFDKVIYWKLITSKNVLINRDRKWFDDNLPTLKQIWDYVLFFRSNADKLQIFKDYMDSRPRKMNKDIMNIVDKLYNTSNPMYDKQIELILDNITATKLQNEINAKEKEKNNDCYMFIDTNKPQPTQSNYVKKPPYNNPYKKVFVKSTQYSKNSDDYPFI